MACLMNSSILCVARPIVIVAVCMCACDSSNIVYGSWINGEWHKSWCNRNFEVAFSTCFQVYSPSTSLFPFILCRGRQSRHDGQYSIPVNAHIFVQLFRISSTSSSNFGRHQTVRCTFPSIRRLGTWHSHDVARFRSNGLDISWTQRSSERWMCIVTTCACTCAMNRTKTESPSQRFINNFVSECGAREIHRNDITLDISVYGRLGYDSIFTTHAHPFVRAMSSPSYCVRVRFFFVCSSYFI